MELPWVFLYDWHWRIFFFVIMKVIGWKIARKISDLFITKDMSMIFLFCSMNQNMCKIFLKYINKKHKNMKFSIETEINGHFFFLMWKYFEKTISLLLVFLEEKLLVRYTLISSVLFHLSTGLVWYTPYWIVVLIYLLTFWNSIMKLKTLRTFC